MLRRSIADILGAGIPMQGDSKWPAHAGNKVSVRFPDTGSEKWTVWVTLRRDSNPSNSMLERDHMALLSIVRY